MVRTRPLSPATLRAYDYVRRRQLSPRVRLAARLWAAGLGTKKHIAQSLGIHPQSMYLHTMPSVINPDAKSTVERINALIEDETVEIGKALRLASRRAVGKIVDTMENGSSEGLRFKAAQDLADRAPETSKTQKVAVASFSLTKDDVQDLARSMVEASHVRREFEHVAEGDFIKIDADKREALPEHAERIAAHEDDGKRD
jgi:hypothetical protein